MDYLQAKEALKLEGSLRIEGNGKRVTEFFEGLDIAGKAIEKQIPKKPEALESEVSGRYYRCSVCGRVVGPKVPYCRICGQAILWD